MYKQFLVLFVVKCVCGQDSVLDVAKQYGANKLVELLQVAELSSALKGKGTCTLESLPHLNKQKGNFLCILDINCSFFSTKGKYINIDKEDV